MPLGRIRAGLSVAAVGSSSEARTVGVQKGTLTTYLGAAPGVGKTAAAAARLLEPLEERGWTGWTKLERAHPAPQ